MKYLLSPAQHGYLGLTAAHSKHPASQASCPQLKLSYDNLSNLTGGTNA